MNRAYPALRQMFTDIRNLWFEKMGRELRSFSIELSDFLYGLKNHPTQQWHERFQAFAAGQRFQGRYMTPDSEEALLAYISQWAAMQVAPDSVQEQGVADGEITSASPTKWTWPWNSAANWNPRDNLSFWSSGFFPNQEQYDDVKQSGPAVGAAPNSAMLFDGVMDGLRRMGNEEQAEQLIEYLEPTPPDGVYIGMAPPVFGRFGKWPRHHPFPVYLGGAIDQTLRKIPRRLHYRFHAALDAYKGGKYARAKSAAAFENIDRGELIDDLTQFYETAENGAFKQYLPDFLQAVKESGF